MSPAQKRKQACFRCKVAHWHCNFGVQDLSAISICLFCKIDDEFKNLRDEGFNKVSELEKRNQELENEVKALKSGGRETNTIQYSDYNVLELDHKVVEIEKNCGLLEANLIKEFETVHKQQSMIIKDVKEVKDSLIDFQLVSGKKASRPRRTPLPVPFETRNKFQILEEEVDTVLIGSSLVRGQGSNFVLKNPKKRRVACYPGANIQTINNIIKKIAVENKKSPLITLIGSNDIFSNEGNYRRLDDIETEFGKLTDNIQAKTDNGIVISILPRLRESQYNLGRAYSINKRVEVMCKHKQITFLNLWDPFYDRSLFLADGIHLNNKGKEKLGRLIHQSVIERIGLYKLHAQRVPENSSVGTVGPNLPANIGNKTVIINNVSGNGEQLLIARNQI
jgi:hypothetical protein